MIDALASEPHYADHLRPVWEALPVEARGTWSDDPRRLGDGRLTLVAAWRDYQATSGPVVLFEHGCGIRYNVDHPSYAGGPGRDRVVLFCNTNELVDHANRSAYPHARHEIVGSPRVDVLRARGAQFTPSPTPVIAFSWHWDCKVAPETRSAFPHYRRELPAIARSASGAWTPLGHAHPRAWHLVRPAYRAWRWPVAPTFEQVVDEAAVYVCDNSSTLFEFAALDRPVVVANSPAYRRNVTHGDGLRFWRHVPGEQVDRAGELPAAIRRALGDDPHQEERRRVVELVYPHCGEAAQRAATAILGVL